MGKKKKAKKEKEVVSKLARALHDVGYGVLNFQYNFDKEVNDKYTIKIELYRISED